MIDTIIFDLDNTLYEYETCHQAGLKAVLFELGKFIELSRDEFDIAYKLAQDEVKYHVKDQAASHNRLIYFKFLCFKNPLIVKSKSFMQIDHLFQM